jgi:hypothetical protein
MVRRVSRPFHVGLLCALFLALGACGSSPTGPTASIFNLDAGPTQPDATVGADALGDDSSPPIQFGDDAEDSTSQQEASVGDGGCGTACGDAQTGGFCGDGIIEGNETCDDGNSVPGPSLHLHGSAEVRRREDRRQRGVRRRQHRRR